jgi:hypothetical protein
VRISTGVADGWRTIQITEAEPDQRAALDELGHPADVVHRYPPGTPARVQEGPWPLNAAEWSVASPFDEIRWENRSLRVPPLEVQRRVEVQRQRRDRVAAIDAFTTGQRGGSRR